jgi:hypothetical protein
MTMLDVANDDKADPLFDATVVTLLVYGSDVKQRRQFLLRCLSSPIMRTKYLSYLDCDFYAGLVG